MSNLERVLNKSIFEFCPGSGSKLRAIKPLSPWRSYYTVQDVSLRSAVAGEKSPLSKYKAVNYKIWSKDRKDHDLDHIWWSWSRSRSNSENLEMIWSFGKISKITLSSFLSHIMAMRLAILLTLKGKIIKTSPKKTMFLHVTRQKFIELKNFIISFQIFLDIRLE